MLIACNNRKVEQSAMANSGYKNFNYNKTTILKSADKKLKEVEEITWNNGLELTIDYEQLKEKYPRLFVEQKPEIYDMLKCDSIVYINKSEFEKCETNTCRLLSIEFDEFITQVSIGNKTISKSTSLTKLANLFKECESLTRTQMFGDTTTYNTCLIMNKYQDLGLHVLSTKGRIVKVEICEP